MLLHFDIIARGLGEYPSTFYFTHPLPHRLDLSLHYLYVTPTSPLATAFYIVDIRTITATYVELIARSPTPDRTFYLRIPALLTPRPLTMPPRIHPFAEPFIFWPSDHDVQHPVFTFEPRVGLARTRRLRQVRASLVATPAKPAALPTWSLSSDAMVGIGDHILLRTGEGNPVALATPLSVHAFERHWTALVCNALSPGADAPRQTFLFLNVPNEQFVPPRETRRTFRRALPYLPEALQATRQEHVQEQGADSVGAN